MQHDEKLWSALRLTLSALLAAHGWARLTSDAVNPFGVWLDTKGVVLSLAIAWSITIFEIVGTLLLAAKKLVFPVTLVFSAIYVAGIVLVHAPAGWFVVGLGRNGSEYSVLLVVVLLCVGFHYRRP